MGDQNKDNSKVLTIIPKEDFDSLYDIESVLLNPSSENDNIDYKILFDIYRKAFKYHKFKAINNGPNIDWLL